MTTATEPHTDSLVPGQRDPRGWLAPLVYWVAVALPALTILIAFTGSFDTLTRRAGHLAVTIPLILLLYPARRGPSASIPWSDRLFAGLALAAFGWIIVAHDRIMWRLVYVDPVPPVDLVLGVVAIIAVLEATRRTLGWTLVVLVGASIAYALAGPLMPGVFEHKGVPFTLLIEHLYLVPEGLFNMVTGVMATYLLVFLAFGTFLRVGGGERIFTDLTLLVAGRWTGGPAKAAVIGSTLMGMISGSTIANVVTTGSITIPLMKRNGFKPYEAAAIETAAGTGGAITPPVMGAGVFIMAEVSGIPLLRILAFSALPALLYFFSIWVYVDVKARKRGLGALKQTTSTETGMSILARGIHLMIPLLILVYMLVRDYSPFYASSASVLALIAAGALRAETRMSPRMILDALHLTTREALVLSATTGSAALIVGVITLTGLMLKVTSALVSLASGSLLLGMTITALIASVLGMGLPITSSYIIVSTLGAPALTELGLSLLAAHLVIFWFAQTATITPPVCMTAFVAAQIAGAPPMRTGFEALRVAKALYLIPLMFAYSNLLSGNWVAMFFDAFAGMCWLAMFPLVTEGYFFGPLNVAGRCAAALAGIMFFISTFSLGLAETLVWLGGAWVVLGVLAVIQVRRRSVRVEGAASELVG
jgi:TRAP transporter 4TM/12TM fusion protein